MLYDIWDHHQKMVRLVREFGHREEDSPKAKAAPEDERQLSLLGEG
jgi:hypothetical protein